MDRHLMQTFFLEDCSVKYIYNQWFFEGKTGLGRRYFENWQPHAVEVANLHEVKSAFIQEKEEAYVIGIDYSKELKEEPRNFWLSYIKLNMWEVTDKKLKWEDAGSSSISGHSIFELIFPINRIIKAASLILRIDNKQYSPQLEIQENIIKVEFDCEKRFDEINWEIDLEEKPKPYYNEKELDKLQPWEFEELIALLLIPMGYRNVRLTGRTGDEGRDIECELPTGFGNAVRSIVEVKSGKGTFGAPEVRKLAGAVAKEEFEFGIFICLGSFTRAAYKEFAIRRMDGSIGIELVDRLELIDLLTTNSFLKE